MGSSSYSIDENRLFRRHTIFVKTAEDQATEGAEESEELSKWWRTVSEEDVPVRAGNNNRGGYSRSRSSSSNSNSFANTVVNTQMYMRQLQQMPKMEQPWVCMQIKVTADMPTGSICKARHPLGSGGSHKLSSNVL